MKKALFILGVLLIGSGFTNIPNQNEIQQSSNADDAFATMCCRRSTNDGQGNVWTARRCVTNDDSQQAMGAACALAEADANTMKKNATHVAVIENPDQG